MEAAAGTSTAIARALRKKVAQITEPRPGERDIYPYIRDLLTDGRFGVSLDVAQVVVDSPAMGVRDAPDLAIYLKGGDGQPIRTADHCIGVIEVKGGDVLRRVEKALFDEKRKYVQTGTKAFYLCDQVRVVRWDAHPLAGRAEYLWADLAQPQRLAECFAPVSSSRATLRAALDDFRAAGEPHAILPIGSTDRYRFIDTVRSAITLIVRAVSNAVDTRVAPDLLIATEAIGRMSEKWGPPSIALRGGKPSVDFDLWINRDAPGGAGLTPDQVRSYVADQIQMWAEIGPAGYALAIEHDLLGGYATRMGINRPVSLGLPRGSPADLTDSGKAVESLVYETSSLIVSRMLMIRFSEDNGFLRRMISNGGISAFSGYARYFAMGMQALMRETYRKVRPLYASLFAEGPLDWVLQSDDDELSDAVLHAMYLLNRWDFSDIDGDILSGVYDHYLDLRRRRALGEVFTRPEIADYVLAACGIVPTSQILDPACGSGTFLVQRLSAELGRLRAAGALDLDAAVRVLGRLSGLDINPFSVTLAQMQVLWHLLDLFKTIPRDAIPAAARRVVAAIRIEGGHTSLETFETMPARQAQRRLDLDVRAARGDEGAVATVSQRFKMIATGTYDAVVGNPPYVRSHRSSMPAHVEADYLEVMVGQADLYVAFLYRAMRYWVRPGGRMGFIVPIAFLTADYAAEMRAVLADYKVVEIIDFEALRKVTFRGVKRPTVALIVENAPGSDDDRIKVTSVSMDCYDKLLDRVDMARAASSLVPRGRLMSSRYHGAADPAGAADEVEADDA